MTKYLITNYGNTRKVFIRGKGYEISKNDTIGMDSKEVPHAKEIADAFEELEFVDVEIIKQSKKKKVVKKKVVKKKKTKAASGKNKKIKRKK